MMMSSSQLEQRTHGETPLPGYEDSSALGVYARRNSIAWLRRLIGVRRIRLLNRKYMHGNEDKLSTKTHLSNFLGQRQLEHDAGPTGTTRGLERRRRFVQTSAAAARAWECNAGWSRSRCRERENIILFYYLRNSQIRGFLYDSVWCALFKGLIHIYIEREKLSTSTSTSDMVLIDLQPSSLLIGLINY